MSGTYTVDALIKESVDTIEHFQDLKALLQASPLPPHCGCFVEGLILDRFQHIAALLSELWALNGDPISGQSFAEPVCFRGRECCSSTYFTVVVVDFLPTARQP